MTNEKQVQDYKESVKAQAEQLVLKGFPETIVKLNSILETSQFKNPGFVGVNQEINIPVPDAIIVNSHTHLPPTKRAKYENNILTEGTKVMALPTEMVHTNKRIVELLESVKPHYKKLIEDSNLVKMWISFMIPKIEDGNNFGVSIQEEILAEVQLVESKAATFFRQTSRYFILRAKNISKVTKYPHIADYRRAVQELDEKEYISLWLIMCEVRNRYCALHDIVLKNLDKIKKPRPSNVTESLY